VVQGEMMSESIEIGDPILILDHALGHLKDQGKDVNDEDVFALQMHIKSVLRGL
jgi:hypothetical protein